VGCSSHGVPTSTVPRLCSKSRNAKPKTDTRNCGSSDWLTNELTTYFSRKWLAGRVRARDSCDSHSIHCQSASLRSRVEQSCSAHLKSPVHITIEADEPGVLQIGGRNVIKREFPPGARCGIDRVGTQRPGRNLCHCGFNRRHIGQRHMFFRPREILRCRCSRSAVANVGCTARYHA